MYEFKKNKIITFSVDLNHEFIFNCLLLEKNLYYILRNKEVELEVDFYITLNLYYRSEIPINSPSNELYKITVKDIQTLSFNKALEEIKFIWDENKVLEFLELHGLLPH